MEDAFDDIIGTIPQLPPPTPGAGQHQGAVGAAPGQQAPPPGMMPVATLPSVGATPMGLAGAQPDGLGAQWDFIEPTDASPGSAMRSAGFTALAAAAGLGVGIAAGGAWGGVAGATLVGASANLYRAQKMWGSDDPSEKHEAVVSAVFGALELAVAAYTGYKAFESRTETHSPAPLTPNASGDDDDGDDSDDE